MSIIQYEVVESDDFTKLSGILEQYFKAGWKLAGGIAVRQGIDRNNDVTHTYLQAIYK